MSRTRKSKKNTKYGNGELESIHGVQSPSNILVHLMILRAGSFLLTHFQHKQSANLRWHFFTQPEQSRSILSLSLPFLLILGKRNKDLKCGALVTWKRQSCFTVLRFLKKTRADFKLFHVGNNHSSSTEGPADVQVLRNGPGWAWEKLI